jgi:hypothetical protein
MKLIKGSVIINKNCFYFEPGFWSAIFINTLKNLSVILEQTFEQHLTPNQALFGARKWNVHSTCGYFVVNNKLIGIDGSDSWATRPIFQCNKFDLILKMQYLKNSNSEKLYKKQTTAKVIPWVYLPSEQFYFHTNKTVRKNIYNLFHISRPAKYRIETIDNLNRYIINNNIKIDNLLVNYNKIEKNEYIEKNKLVNIGLSLKGTGHSCLREIEYFSMGIPTIMPPYKTKFDMDIVPNVHYMECISDKPEDIIASYLELANSPDKMVYISHNCKTWYDENIRPTAIHLNLRSILEREGII